MELDRRATNISKSEVESGQAVAKVPPENPQGRSGTPVHDGTPKVGSGTDN